MKVTLPNGLLDGQDLFNIAIIDELRGKQQNYLANRELVEGNIGHIPKILEDLVLSLETKEGMQWGGKIKDAVWKLPSSDLETLLIKIRENTYGPRYYFESVCPDCGHVSKDQRLDLDKLEIKRMTAKQMTDEKKRTVLLPKSSKTVVLKPLYLQDMFDGLKIALGKKDELITSAVVLSIDTVDGIKATAKDLESLPMTDIMFIETSMEDMKLEGDIDTSIEMSCSKCSKEFSDKLNVYDPNFFFPTRGSKSTST